MVLHEEEERADGVVVPPSGCIANRKWGLVWLWLKCTKVKSRTFKHSSCISECNPLRVYIEPYTGVFQYQISTAIFGKLRTP